MCTWTSKISTLLNINYLLEKNKLVEIYLKKKKNTACIWRYHWPSLLLCLEVNLWGREMVRHFLTIGDRLKGGPPRASVGEGQIRITGPSVEALPLIAQWGNWGPEWGGHLPVSDRARTGSHASSIPGSCCVSGPPLFSGHGLWHVCLPSCLRPQLTLREDGASWPEPGVVRGELLLLLKQPLASLWMSLFSLLFSLSLGHGDWTRRLVIGDLTEGQAEGIPKDD